MDYNITLTANHQSLTAEYLPLAAESVQYLTAKVVCETEDWTGREIKAMFGQGCTVHEITVTDGEITAKQQLNLTAGDWRVWLVGNSARDGEVIPRITTNIAHISVSPTGGTEGNPFPAIPPTVEEQLRADMGNLADLTTEDKSSLVAAINEAATSGGSKDAVTYTPQTLTEAQQAQARTNIGAEKAGTGYTKPASGIPKTDLEQDVQTSLDKADTAISLGLTAATPGQIIKVKAVQDGKPTEWEAADMAGGEGKWNIVHEQTITEDIEAFSHDITGAQAAAITVAPNASVAAGWKRFILNGKQIPFFNGAVQEFCGVAIVLDLKAPIKAQAFADATVTKLGTYGLTGVIRAALTAGGISEITNIGIGTKELLPVGAKVTIYTKGGNYENL